MNTSYDMITITAPNIDSPEYGKKIDEQFDNINNNFSKLANHDFIKGENGSSIEVDNVNIVKLEIDNPSIPVEPMPRIQQPEVNIPEINIALGQKLYNALKEYFKKYNERDKEINGVKWDSNINSYKTAISFLVNNDINYKKPIGSAVPMMFFDPRFSSKTIENTTDLAIYSDVDDLTSIVNFKYENDNWVCTINNSFPRLRYENGYFNWVLNEDNSIIRATGLKGEAGDNGNMLISIYKGEIGAENKEITLTQYLGGDGVLTDIGENIGKEGDTVIVFVSDNNKYQGYYITKINQVGLESDSNKYNWVVNLNEDFHVQLLDFANNTYEFFKSLNINNSNNESAQGIFLPFNNGETKAHVIYNNGSELNIKAVNNYNNFNSNQETSAINIDAKDSSINMNSDIKLKTQYSKFNINEESIEMNSGLVSITSANGINIEVTGDQPTNNVTIDSDVNITGSVSSSLGFFQTSDERLKEFKGDINIDLDKIFLIPKKYFTWKLDRNGKIEIGTSAQELQKLYPELVSKDVEGKLNVAYDKLSVVALRAIDVLNSKNKELEARIERLEKLMK